MRAVQRLLTAPVYQRRTAGLDSGPWLADNCTPGLQDPAAARPVGERTSCRPTGCAQAQQPSDLAVDGHGPGSVPHRHTGPGKAGAC